MIGQDSLSFFPGTLLRIESDLVRSSIKTAGGIGEQSPAPELRSDLQFAPLPPDQTWSYSRQWAPVTPCKKLTHAGASLSYPGHTADLSESATHRRGKLKHRKRKIDLSIRQHQGSFPNQMILRCCRIARGLSSPPAARINGL